MNEEYGPSGFSFNTKSIDFSVNDTWATTVDGPGSAISPSGTRVTCRRSSMDSNTRRSGSASTTSSKANLATASATTSSTPRRRRTPRVGVRRSRTPVPGVFGAVHPAAVAENVVVVYYAETGEVRMKKISSHGPLSPFHTHLANRCLDISSPVSNHTKQIFGHLRRPVLRLISVSSQSFDLLDEEIGLRSAVRDERRKVSKPSRSAFSFGRAIPATLPARPHAFHLKHRQLVDDAGLFAQSHPHPRQHHSSYPRTQLEGFQAQSSNIVYVPPLPVRPSDSHPRSLPPRPGSVIPFLPPHRNIEDRSLCEPYPREKSFDTKPLAESLRRCRSSGRDFESGLGLQARSRSLGGGVRWVIRGRYVLWTGHSMFPLRTVRSVGAEFEMVFSPGVVDLCPSFAFRSGVRSRWRRSQLRILGDSAAGLTSTVEYLDGEETDKESSEEPGVPNDEALWRPVLERRLLCCLIIVPFSSRTWHNNASVRFLDQAFGFDDLTCSSGLNVDFPFDHTHSKRQTDRWVRDKSRSRLLGSFIFLVDARNVFKELSLGLTSSISIKSNKGQHPSNQPSQASSWELYRRCSLHLCWFSQRFRPSVMDIRRHKAARLLTQPRDTCPCTSLSFAPPRQERPGSCGWNSAHDLPVSSTSRFLVPDSDLEGDWKTDGVYYATGSLKWEVNLLTTGQKTRTPARVSLLTFYIRNCVNSVFSHFTSLTLLEAQTPAMRDDSARPVGITGIRGPSRLGAKTRGAEQEMAIRADCRCWKTNVCRESTQYSKAAERWAGTVTIRARTRTPGDLQHWDNSSITSNPPYPVDGGKRPEKWM
ncbi:hypothetical protein KC354_g8 [Hortaea werneckii]|nr:hypothetical protein KC354_g8 [Hortaea werneckii]